MLTGKTYKFGGLFYTLIDGVVMMRLRLNREWRRSHINDDGYDVEFFSIHVAKEGRLID